jgi:hypothetical protein
LRLCDESETVAPPIVPQPGDSIFYMHHQDIACYSYERRCCIKKFEGRALYCSGSELTFSTL